MKVLILANFGMGLYKFRKELLSELLAQNFEVTVSFPKDEFVSKIEELGCKYIETNVDRRGTNIIEDIKLFSSYIKLVKKEKADIVLTYTIKPNIYGGMVCRLTKTPYISNITGLGTSIENGGILSKISLLLYKIGLGRSKEIFFQNKENKYFFEKRKLLTCKGKLLPGSGVNLTEFQIEDYPLETERLILLYVGRLMEAKGTKELFSVAKKIRENNKNVEFHLVGFSEDNFETQINELIQEEVIHYHGQKNDVKNLIKNCHAVIHPTHHEGMSNVLLEASAMGRPVIASNIPGCQEIFQDGKTGLGFEAKNEESLLRAINTFIQLPYEIKREMGQAARIKIENEFDRQLVVKEYTDTIKKIVGEK